MKYNWNWGIFFELSPDGAHTYLGTLMFGMEVKGDPGDDWVVATGAGYRLAFQQAPDLQPPDWPDPDRPQQFHLDVRVADVEAAEPKVLELGARRLPGGGGDFRVYADPVGHPFCLVWDV